MAERTSATVTEGVLQPNTAPNSPEARASPPAAPTAVTQLMVKRPSRDMRLVHPACPLSAT